MIAIRVPTATRNDFAKRCASKISANPFVIHSKIMTRLPFNMLIIGLPGSELQTYVCERIRLDKGMTTYSYPFQQIGKRSLSPRGGMRRLAISLRTMTSRDNRLAGQLMSARGSLVADDKYLAGSFDYPFPIMSCTGLQCNVMESGPSNALASGFNVG